MQSGSEFTAALERWVQKIGDQAEALARQTCQETGERVLKATPVDTGFLRGSWQPSINGYAATPPPEGVKPAPDVSLVCSGIKPGDVFYMVTNAAYALRIEYGFVGTDSLGREYNQAGQYFVRDTVAQYDAIVDGVAKDLGFA